jgi:hypothetical protein
VPLDCAGCLATSGTQGLCFAAEAMGGRANIWLAGWVSTLDQRLRVTTRNIRDVDLPCYDSHHGEAIGIKPHTSHLFKHPLRDDRAQRQVAS